MFETLRSEITPEISSLEAEPCKANIRSIGDIFQKVVCLTPYLGKILPFSERSQPAFRKMAEVTVGLCLFQVNFLRILPW